MTCGKELARGLCIALVGFMAILRPASASVVAYDFSGVFFASGGNLPAAAFPVGTSYTATVTYDTSVIGHVDPHFSYYTDYDNAVTSLVFTVGAQQFSVFNGVAITGVTPNNANPFFFQNFTGTAGSLDGVATDRSNTYLALRDFTGTANPSGLITDDLSGFAADLQSSTVELAFSNNGAFSTFFYFLGQVRFLLDKRVGDAVTFAFTTGAVRTA
jgi:hypothetical protein